MKYFKYLGYLLKHKWYVMKACFNQGLYWRGLMHDISKFRPSEFIPYARNFYGDKTELIDELIILRNFDYAVQHHKNRNKHHWEYWLSIDKVSGKIWPLEMPLKDMQEMVCDWWGCGMAKRKKNTAINPYELEHFYYETKQNRLLHKDTERRVEKFVDEICVKMAKKMCP